MLVYILTHISCPMDFISDSHCLVLHKGVSADEFLSSLKGFWQEILTGMAHRCVQYLSAKDIFIFK